MQAFRGGTLALCQPALHRSKELRLQVEQRHICRVDKRSASTMPTLVDAPRLSTLQVSS